MVAFRKFCGGYVVWSVCHMLFQITKSVTSIKKNPFIVLAYNTILRTPMQFSSAHSIVSYHKKALYHRHRQTIEIITSHSEKYSYATSGIAIILKKPPIPHNAFRIVDLFDDESPIFVELILPAAQDGQIL